MTAFEPDSEAGRRIQQAAEQLVGGVGGKGAGLQVRGRAARRGGGLSRRRVGVGMGLVEGAKASRGGAAGMW